MASEHKEAPMSELVFYTNPMSRGRIIRWMLEEVGQPYRTELIDFATTGKSPQYLAVNPMGKVPAIVHDGTVVTECGAICAYLADAFPQARLAPPSGSPRRGTYYRWLFFAAGPIEQAVSVKSMGWEAPAERSVMLGFGSMDTVLNAIEGAVRDREFLDGEAFTAADLYLGAHLGWGMQFGSIEARPAFEAYVARQRQRPAAIRAAKIDDDLLAAASPQPVPAE
jgi:glutathione S-transferase